MPFILFFNEDRHFIWDSEKYIWGWFSVPPYCSSYAICSSESIEGNPRHSWWGGSQFSVILFSFRSVAISFKSDFQRFAHKNLDRSKQGINNWGP